MITISAKTLDEAITKALIELQITSDHLYYEIVEKGTNGLFGIIGVKPYVIRARVKSEKEERDEREAAKKAAKIEQAEKEAAERAEKEVPEEEEREEPKITPGEPPKEKEAKERYGKTDINPQQNRNQKLQKGEKAERRELQEARPVIKADPEAIESKAKEFLLQIFKAMEIEVELQISYHPTEGELQVTMKGKDMGILIGKRGQTLDSLQYLVSLVVNREADGYIRVKLDTENYRERRKETLETLARNIAYKVKRTKRAVSLEPMNPYERRIIHSTLQSDKYILTRSEGEDPFRHVVISLKRENHKK